MKEFFFDGGKHSCTTSASVDLAFDDFGNQHVVSDMIQAFGITSKSKTASLSSSNRTTQKRQSEVPLQNKPKHNSILSKD